MIKTEKKLFLSTGWLKTLDLMAIMATVEKIITYALGEHNPGSAPDGRTSSELWSLVLPYIIFHSCFYKKEFQFLFRKKKISSIVIFCHPLLSLKCHAKVPLANQLTAGAGAIEAFVSKKEIVGGGWRGWNVNIPWLATSEVWCKPHHSRRMFCKLLLDIEEHGHVSLCTS